MKSSALRKIVGENIRGFRLLRKFSQEKLAVRAKLSQEYISFVERGIMNISVDSLCRISEALNIEPHLLLTPDASKKSR
ncbi:MAG TPA: helix-turn-helix transcriptional regulator [Candidatus Kapabacteria bacterium]|nr:helix-turn-helix transcriptional regulator [Candidatus Kapabacteria bacterium]